MKIFKKKNKGFYTLESLIALLIFSIGIVGILNLQTSSISNVTDGLYRITASNLAENILGQIFLDRNDLAGYVNKDNEEYDNWLNEVEKALPGVEDNPPIIEVSEEAYGKSVRVVVRWKNPTSTAVSNYETNITLY